MRRLGPALLQAALLYCEHTWYQASGANAARWCSSSSRRPPGRRTRAISRSAAPGCGNTHRLNVSTTQSKDASAYGSAATSPAVHSHWAQTGRQQPIAKSGMRYHGQANARRSACSRHSNLLHSQCTSASRHGAADAVGAPCCSLTGSLSAAALSRACSVAGHRVRRVSAPALAAR